MTDPILHDITGGTWDVYSFLNETGQLVVVSFNIEAALEERPVNLNTNARVIVRLPINAVGKNGLPAETAFEQLRRIEKHLIRSLEENTVECRLLGRKTWDGKQEFVFQTAELQSFSDAIRPMLEKDSAYRMELESQAGWDYFEQNIKPSPKNWQVIQDRKTMGELLRAGADPSAKQILRFTFLGEPKPLKRIEELLLEKGFARLEGEKGRLVMGKESMLYPDLIFSMSGELFDLSVSVGARYAGWQAVPLE